MILIPPHSYKAGIQNICKQLYNNCWLLLENITGIQTSTPPYIYKSVYLEFITSLYYDNCDGSIHACDLYYNHIYMLMFHQTYICLCFIKIVLVNDFLLLPHIYLCVLPCICVFLVTAIHAIVYCVTCGSADIILFQKCMKTQKNLIYSTLLKTEKFSS